ncbi:uncharacterized protein AKAW2_40420S [Aspergillus luchuensis]|uniref:Uncharacterized protein n=1 Tax=Aspergillus kawachii TaxID=1069201 RepID=A0A7R7W988_ASPKA|nr:uncharacterized protein AKAW2_40420S [Aspergillus luchuensis]BCR98737.1 hypothetical protein AKAW2_40420S [Aspergillus luchuensis]
MSPKSEVAIGARHGGTEQSRAHNGQGTSTDPFIVEFKRDDPENPMNWSASRKWFIAFIVTSSVFAVTFASSAYSDSSDEIIKDFNISTEVFSVGISLFILGFAVGPAVWAPLLL